MAAIPKSKIKELGGLLRIGDKAPLPNQPAMARIPTLGDVMLGGSSDIEKAARQYAERNGYDYYEVLKYAQLNPNFSAQVAREYDLMPHNPNDPAVKSAYDKLASETADQYEAMLSMGIKPYFITGKDPYQASPYMSLLDLQQNGRIGIFPTRSGFGTSEAFDPAGNPLMAESGLMLDGQPLLINDMFRAVHDVFGHGKGGFGFRGMGEENAYRAHSGMYSPEASRAAATETRGQNSWLNYGPYGEQNRNATIGDTVFADQKTGLLPNWATTQGTPRGEARRNDFFRNLEGIGERDLSGLRGAVTDNGTLKLVHYSRQPLDRVDPSQYGKGLSGRTLAERNRSFDPDFQNRSYYGIEGTDNPYRKEGGLGNYRNETEIPVEQMYDIQADPLNLRSKIDNSLSDADQTTQLEKIINEQGFSGYFTRGKGGDVAAIFDPLNVGKTHKFSIAAGIGAGALAGLGSEDIMANPIADLRASEAQFDMSPQERAIADLRASEAGFVPTSDPQWKPARFEGLANVTGAIRNSNPYKSFTSIGLNPLEGTMDYVDNLAWGQKNSPLDILFAGAELGGLGSMAKGVKAGSGLLNAFGADEKARNAILEGLLKEYGY